MKSKLYIIAVAAIVVSIATILIIFNLKLKTEKVNTEPEETQQAVQEEVPVEAIDEASYLPNQHITVDTIEESNSAKDIEVPVNPSTTAEYIEYNGFYATSNYTEGDIKDIEELQKADLLSYTSTELNKYLSDFFVSHPHITVPSMHTPESWIKVNGLVLYDSYYGGEDAVCSIRIKPDDTEVADIDKYKELIVKSAEEFSINITRDDIQFIDTEPDIVNGIHYYTVNIANVGNDIIVGYDGTNDIYVGWPG